MKTRIFADLYNLKINRAQKQQFFLLVGNSSLCSLVELASYSCHRSKLCIQLVENMKFRKFRKLTYSKVGGHIEICQKSSKSQTFSRFEDFHFWHSKGQLGPIKGSGYGCRALKLLPSDLPSNFTSKCWSNFEN